MVSGEMTMLLMLSGEMMMLLMLMQLFARYLAVQWFMLVFWTTTVGAGGGWWLVG